MLPVNNTPRYTTTLPSTGKVIKFRPFLVREEKALLIAQQSEELDVIINTLESIIESCTDGMVKPETLAIFDIEWLILQFRARSVGEVVDLTFRCDDCQIEESDVVVNLDLLTIELEKSKEHNKNIILFGDVGVTMKYPSMAIFKELEDVAGDDIDNFRAEDVEKLFDVIIKCIDSVFDEKTVYPASETPTEELKEFLNNLTKDQFEKLQDFFKTMPKLSKEVDYKCPLCGKQHKKVIRGFQNFFR